MEKIIEAYGEHWNQVSRGHIGNGWISTYNVDWGFLMPKISKSDLQQQGMFWRMRTLSELTDLYTTIKNM